MSLTPQWYSRLPSFFGKRRGGESNFDKWFEDLENEAKALFNQYPSGLSVSSDEKNIYIEADLPGLTAKDIDVSFDSNGVLWIKGQRKEEEREDKKYYRHSQQVFSYCIPLGDEVDTTVEPNAICKHGVMRITFPKRKEKQTEAKKIRVTEQS
jgi:HSP20 family protein